MRTKRASFAQSAPTEVRQQKSLFVQHIRALENKARLWAFTFDPNKQHKYFPSYSASQRRSGASRTACTKSGEEYFVRLMRCPTRSSTGSSKEMLVSKEIKQAVVCILNSSLHQLPTFRLESPDRHAGSGGCHRLSNPVCKQDNTGLCLICRVLRSVSKNESRCLKH